MEWKTMLAYITGSVDQELLLRNEYHQGSSRSDDLLVLFRRFLLGFFWEVLDHAGGGSAVSRVF